MMSGERPRTIAENEIGEPGVTHSTRVAGRMLEATLRGGNEGVVISKRKSIDGKGRDADASAEIDNDLRTKSGRIRVEVFTKVDGKTVKEERVS